ncbi:hypothetical protein BFW38_06220 [Terasakiispira papahanaumokuakeensis]|uniref:Lipoprotein n=1 Tax=Terasakiispira papahanaumokuakeensis TaxID=197479 RepID=A0A1E2V857_9GAMM|nr:hypothetical protein [Terasakiispira papahanaumokuakeensis]ODC03199.1 hypothetical protein BFW38_06220 [Terasakiispira papahanaumokuakeensis]
MSHSLPLFSAALLAAALTGCATQKVEDKTPLVDTSVVKADYVIAGYILPDMKGEQVTYTRPDRRSITSTTEYDSWFSRQFFGNAHQADIARLDKNLAWFVDYENETYRECPLKGCDDINIWDELASSGDEEAEEEAYDPSGGESCQMTTANFDFSVTPKDRNRDINGFRADQYVATWKMVATDDKGKQDKHVVTMDFWMTEARQQHQAVWDINGQFQNGYLSKVVNPANPLSRFFGEDIYKAIAMVSGDIEKKEMNSDSVVLRKLNAIKGYPVSIKLEWYADSQACQDQKEAVAQNESSGFDMNDPLGSLGQMAGDMVQSAAEKEVKRRMAHDKNDPLLTYIYDITSAKVQPEHESRFEVPAGYMMQDRR